MALYLGNQKVCPIIYKEIQNNQLTGKIMSDNNGIITFPALDFEPKLIAVWNVVRYQNGDGIEMAESLITGVMLFAVYTADGWVSQGLTGNSGGVYITNASAEGGTGESFPQSSSSGISINNNIYSFQLARYYDIAGRLENAEYYDITNTEFNYAIYG